MPPGLCLKKRLALMNTERKSISKSKATAEPSTSTTTEKKPRQCGRKATTKTHTFAATKSESTRPKVQKTFSPTAILARWRWNKVFDLGGRYNSCDSVGSVCTLYFRDFNQPFEFDRLLPDKKFLPTFMLVYFCKKSNDFVIPFTFCKFRIIKSPHTHSSNFLKSRPNCRVFWTNVQNILDESIFFYYKDMYKTWSSISAEGFYQK